MLEPFGQNIWSASGPVVPAYLGFRYPTRMLVVKLADGGLWLWSPIALTDALKSEIDALGTVRALIAPNTLHHLSIGEWKAACPQAKIYAPPGLQKKRSDLVIDCEIGEGPLPEWDGQISHVVVGGNAITTEVVFFHRESGTAIFTDILQQFPFDWFTGWRGLVAKWDLMAGTEPHVPRKFRVAFTNRKLARAAIERILAWPTDKVMLAHGTPVTGDGQAFLKHAFAWLKQ